MEPWVATCCFLSREAQEVVATDAHPRDRGHALSRFAHGVHGVGDVAALIRLALPKTRFGPVSYAPGPRDPRNILGITQHKGVMHPFLKDHVPINKEFHSILLGH